MSEFGEGNECFKDSTEHRIKSEIKYLEEIQVELQAGNSFDDLLPIERQLEIIQLLIDDTLGIVDYQDKVAKQEMQENKEPYSDGILEKAQWVTPATTPPVTLEYSSVSEVEAKIAKLEDLGMLYKIDEDNDKKIKLVGGHRISFAFYKRMCDYKKKDGSGCRSCMLSLKNRLVKNVTPEQQLSALDDAIKSTEELGNKRTVFEILPDGSFLNKEEVSVETQDGMMERLSKVDSIHRVAIETRPEYCHATEVSRLLSKLQPPDKKLNIYFGLETVSDFVGKVIHKKGYGLKEFENAIKRLKNDLTEDELKRLDISAYHLIKPAYLTEQEAIDGAVKMAEEIDEFSREIGLSIDIKYEPGVVSVGTVQNYLYNKNDEQSGERRYEPLNYLSVAELIANLNEKNLDHIAKFGQRDDIDKYSTVAMVPQIKDENMFSQYDFLVYNAVQRFNTTCDIRRFLVDMKSVVEGSEEFQVWEKEFYGQSGASALSRLTEKEFFTGELSESEKQAVEFQEKVWDVCDNIEYSEKLSNDLRKRGGKAVDEAKKEIEQLFVGRQIKIFEIKDLIFIDIGEEQEDRLPEHGTCKDFSKNSIKSSYQVEIVILNENKIPQSVWVKIPLIHAELPV